MNTSFCLVRILWILKDLLKKPAEGEDIDEGEPAKPSFSAQDAEAIWERKEKEKRLSLHVTPKAVRSAIYLAEMFENAKRAEDLKFKKWIKEEAMT